MIYKYKEKTLVQEYNGYQGFYNAYDIKYICPICNTVRTSLSVKLSEDLYCGTIFCYKCRTGYALYNNGFEISKNSFNVKWVCEFISHFGKDIFI